MESPQGGFVNLLQTGSPRPNTTQERVPWTKDEEEKLVEAWISASQDPIEGDSQTFGCFWEKFGGIYNNLLNIRKAGQMILMFSWRLWTKFEKKTKATRKTFLYVKLWLKLKDAQKWKEQTEGSSQSFDGRTHFDINEKRLDLEDEQPLRWPIGRNKAKKRLQRLLDLKFDCYVHVQETKAEMLNRVEQKMIETQSVIQTKTDMEILKMKADNLEGEDLELLLAMKESIRVRRKNKGSFF
uniref:Myb-like domain-containing protein n=1 Tax=Lactuca sativa TaxID=4236 RepID=A0A9R1VJG9_LACSA|nr:hypothetical protein LSAT_V11C500276000 [Lactuca sativa]